MLSKFKHLIWFVAVLGLACPCALSQDPSSCDTPPRAPSFVEDLAGRVADRTGLPTADPADRPEEYRLYCLTLNTARAASIEAFANSTLHGVTYAHLFEQPDKYRGEVVSYQGRLKRVRKFDAPDPLKAEISSIYECGIFDLNRYGANPIIAIMTELPPNVPVAEELDIPVSARGYFFKLWRYKAGDAWRDAPLIIGRTVQLAPGAQWSTTEDVNTSFTRDLVIGTIGLFGATIGLIAILGWWYRRGDKRVQNFVDARRRNAVSEPVIEERLHNGTPSSHSLLE